MTSPFLRTLFFFWLCCYLAGPLVQMFDSWDSLEEEMGDIAFSTSGVLIWAGAAIAIAMLLFRHFCKVCKYLDRVYGIELPTLIVKLATTSAATEAGLILASPPLRI